MDVVFTAERSAAKSIASELRSDGYKPRIERISERAPDDPEVGALGYLVRSGSFTTQAGAEALEARLKRDGYSTARVVYTGEDGGKTTGPWVVHVLEVDPDIFGGNIRPELATTIVPGSEPLTSISERVDS